MKVGTWVRVIRFNGAKAFGKIKGKARIGARGAWYPVRLDDGTDLMCRAAQLTAL